MRIEHDINGARFVATVDGEEAVLEYRRIDEGTLDYVRTYVPSALRGRGVATRLVEHALDHAAEAGMKVVPSCWFVARVVDETPRYAGLVATER